jgi:ribosomal protein L40E
MSRKKAKAKRARQRDRERYEAQNTRIAKESSFPPWKWWLMWFRGMWQGGLSLLGEGKPMPASACRDCGATNDPGASECWLCHRRDWRADPASTTSQRAAGSSDRALVISSLGTLLIAMAIGIVEIGVTMLAPGLGITLLFLLVPAWAITEWKARHRAKPIPAWQRFALMVGVIIFMPALLVLSLLVALMVLCTGVLSLLFASMALCTGVLFL